MFKIIFYSAKQNISQMKVKTQKQNKKISSAQANEHML